jgi:hypothetical protein
MPALEPCRGQEATYDNLNLSEEFVLENTLGGRQACLPELGIPKALGSSESVLPGLQTLEVTTPSLLGASPASMTAKFCES